MRARCRQTGADSRLDLLSSVRRFSSPVARLEAQCHHLQLDLTSPVGSWGPSHTHAADVSGCDQLNKSLFLGKKRPLGTFRPGTMYIVGTTTGGRGLFGCGCSFSCAFNNNMRFLLRLYSNCYKCSQSEIGVSLFLLWCYEVRSAMSCTLRQLKEEANLLTDDGLLMSDCCFSSLYNFWRKKWRLGLYSQFKWLIGYVSIFIYFIVLHRAEICSAGKKKHLVKLRITAPGDATMAPDLNAPIKLFIEFTSPHQ